MIWVAWRLHRLQLITLLVVLVVGAVAVVLLRSAMLDDIAALRIADCVTSTGPACQGTEAVGDFRVEWLTPLNLGQGAILSLPAMIGVFIGAPLFARELEQGTHVLAFTQSVSRTRWMVGKLLVAAVPAVVVLIALQQLVWWWLSAAGNLGPLVNGPFHVLNIGIENASPVGYALFAFALGTFLGVASRRTLVAMTGGLAAFIVVRFALFDLPGHLVPLRHLETDAGGSLSESQGVALTIDKGWLDAAGQRVPDDRVGALIQACKPTGTQDEFLACLPRSGLVKKYADFVPESQAWQVHLVDVAVFGGLAVLLLVGTGWALRRQS